MLIENPLNSYKLAFPAAECLHIVGFAISVGTVAIVDFRLLGVGITSRSAAELWSDTWRWTLGGLILVFFSGLLLFSSDPDNYYLNYAFLLKMLFLALAIAWNYTAVRAQVRGPAAGKAGLTAAIALGLWALVAFGGIFIAFITPTLNIHHI